MDVLDSKTARCTLLPPLFASFSGRPIWYQYGSPYTWNRHGGAGGSLRWGTTNFSTGGVNSCRSGFDMGDSWGLVGEQIGGVVEYNRRIQTNRCDGGVCPWPDADCLAIGNNLSTVNVVQAQS